MMATRRGRRDLTVAARAGPAAGSGYGARHAGRASTWPDLRQNGLIFDRHLAAVRAATLAGDRCDLCLNCNESRYSRQPSRLPALDADRTMIRRNRLS